MAIFSAILAALSAIPKILSELQLIRGEFEKANQNAFFALNTKTMQDIGKAKTEEEYKAAEKELSETLSKL